jgi:hypothetical protein
MKNFRLVLAVMTLIAVLTSGCSQNSGGFSSSAKGPDPNFMTRRINGDVGEVRPIAERVFRSHFRYDADLSSGNRMVSRPTEVEGRGEPHNVRDRIRLSPARRQEKAELMLKGEEGVTIVQVNVRAERLETVERSSFAGLRGDDRPTQTPIDRPGPSGVDAREEWVNAGRDSQTERDILDEIEMSFKHASEAPASAPSP